MYFLGPVIAAVGRSCVARTSVVEQTPRELITG